MINRSNITAKRVSRSRSLVSNAVCASLLVSLGATAAETQQSEAAEELEELELIVVTGSRIRGVAPTGSNLLEIGSAEIEKMPATNIVNLLQREPAFTGIGNSEGVKRSVGSGVRGVNSSRGSDINLRGIGPRATLVMFNGMRMPPTGATGRNMDSSMIPSLVMERIEVVPDGASAIYGSDAIAGVVNFIARDSYDGAQTRVRFGSADSYDALQIGQLVGSEWDTGGFVLGFEFNGHSSLNGTDRDWYRSDLRARGGRDYRATQCSPGTIVVDGVSYAIPAGGVTAANVGDLVPGTRNRCELSRLADILPEQQTYSGYGSVTQRVGERSEVYFRGIFSQREFDLYESIVGSQALTATVTVPGSNPYFVRPPGTTGPVRVDYSFINDRGVYDYGGKARWIQAQAGVKTELWGDWEATLDYSFARSDSSILVYGIYNPALNAALASTDPATALNPFGGPNSAALMGEIFRNHYDPYGHGRTNDVSLSANGSLFDLPGGTVRLAVGGEYYRLKFYAGNHIGDARTAEANKVSKYSPRDVTSAYTEVFVPVVGAGNAVPGIESLDLSAAVRYDRYSDVGGTTNPKIGLNWEPFNGLTLKASYGTSFKAPFVNDTASPAVGASLVYSTVIDPLSPTGTSSGISWSDGNPDLGPEEATTRSYTALFEPDAIPGLRVSGTYFSIDYRDAIDGINATSALANPLLAPWVIRNPTPQQIADLEARAGIPYRGTVPASISWIVDTRNQNLGGLRMEGVDFSLSQSWRTSIGQWDAGISGTYVTKYDVQVLKGAAYTDERNTLYNPLKLRMRGNIGWRNQNVTAEAFVNYTNGYDNIEVAPVQKVGSYTTVDVRAAYDFFDTDGWLSDVTVGLEALNVLDKDPPFVDIDSGADLSVASALGRYVSLSITKRW